MTSNLRRGGWTPSHDAKLRALWKTGDRTGLIAIAMGKTKNAVIGRAHRLGLEPRKSPIAGRISKPRVERQPRVQTGPLKRAQIATRLPIEDPKPTPAPIREPEPQPVEELSPTREPETDDAAQPFRPFMLPAGRCQWITGEVTGDDNCKCGAKIVPGAPYCRSHLMRAYQRRQPEAPTAA